jgi:hypothetical protein
MSAALDAIDLIDDALHLIECVVMACSHVAMPIEGAHIAAVANIASGKLLEAAELLRSDRILMSEMVTKES